MFYSKKITQVQSRLARLMAVLTVVSALGGSNAFAFADIDLNCPDGTKIHLSTGTDGGKCSVKEDKSGTPVAAECQDVNFWTPNDTSYAVCGQTPHCLETTGGGDCRISK